MAAISDDTRGLKSSLALGAEPWIREGKYRLSMLHFAALHGNRESVAALLERHADPCSLDSSNFLPLQRAIHHGHWEVCDQLLSAMEGWPVPESREAGEILAVAIGLLVDLQQSTRARRLATWCRRDDLFGIWSGCGWTATVKKIWDADADGHADTLATHDRTALMKAGERGQTLRWMHFAGGQTLRWMHLLPLECCPP